MVFVGLNRKDDRKTNAARTLKGVGIRGSLKSMAGRRLITLLFLELLAMCAAQLFAPSASFGQSNLAQTANILQLSGAGSFEPCVFICETGGGVG